MTSPIRTVLPASILLTLIGGGGIVWLLIATRPTLGPRWLFFFFGVLLTIGAALPLVALLNQRFGGAYPVDLPILFRQSLWAALYLSALAWLQLGRVLTPAIAFLLLFGFILIEFLLRMRERSQWKPQ
ncbi:MAG: hypothetical protein OHK0052_07350 [Anaerolineales bacterium]